MIPNSKKIYLCSPDLKRIAVLNGVQTQTVDFHPQVKGYSELSFDVDRYITLDNGQKLLSNGYKKLMTYMYLYLEDIGYFVMETPEVTYDGNNEVKSINALSVEKEFEGRDWVGIKINCGTSDSLEYSYTDESNVDKYGFAIQYITMLNYQNLHLSFLHLILEKMSSKWHIGYVSPNLINAKIPAIDIDSENLYAVMTSEVAPRLSCLFIFDYLNFTINVYHKDDIDLDTSIFIGFRNLEQQVSISTDSDSIFTRFTVQGDNGLEFRDINYGENYIINLDYFLTNPYMDEDMIAKYNSWREFRDNHIQDYIDLAKQHAELVERREERVYRVPSDASYWTNWDSMNEEGLRENLAYYQEFLEKLQISVDDRSQSQMYDSQGNYIPKKKNGEVDHDWYEQQLYDKVNVYGGYYTYLEIVTYIIPYIELAISNLNKIEKTDPDYDITQNWELYGLEELKGVRDSHNDQLADLSMYARPWSELTQDEQLEYISEAEYEALPGRIQYLKLKAALGTETTPGTILYHIKKLEDEIAQIEAQIEVINNITNEYAIIVKYNATSNQLNNLTHLSSSIISERRSSLFNTNELRIFDALLKDTDYVNSNILTISSTSLDGKFEAEQELLDDAEDKLSEVSQPQYKFSVSMDNFFRLEDYKKWADEFGPSASGPQIGLLKFIRVGLRDDYAVKLRVIGYRWNPCEVTPDLQIDFSNMITSRSGRTDFTELLDSDNYRGSKNSIRIGTGSVTSEQEYISALMDILKDNSIFVREVKNIASGVTNTNVIYGGGGGASVPVIQGVIGNYVSNGGIDSYLGPYVASQQINVGNLTGEAGDFEEIFTRYLGAEFISTQIIDADTGYFNDLYTDALNAIEINATHIVGEQGDFDQLAANVLTAGEATITNLISDNIFVTDIKGTSGEFDQFFVNNLNVNNVFGNNAEFQQIIADQISAHTITANEVIAALGNFDTLFAETAFVEHLEANTLATVLSNSNISNIAHAVIGSLTTEEILGGHIILSENLKILSSETENVGFVIDGQRLQFWGETSEGDPYVAVQLGYDASGKPSLILMDEDNAAVFSTNGIYSSTGELIAEKGITANAIADGLIVNDMIHEHTIDEDKLNFSVLKEGDNIYIDQVYTSAGEPWFGTEYTSFKEFTDTVIDLVNNGEPTYTWIAYANSSKPSPDEFLDDSSNATYVGIGANKPTQEQTTDYQDYEWFKFENGNAEVSDTQKIYYKSVYDDISHIPYPSNSALLLQIHEGIISVEIDDALQLDYVDWTSKRPEYTPGTYLWTSTRVVLEDGTVIFTTPTLVDDYIENDTVIGGAQLIRNSKTLIDTRIYWYL